MCPQGKDCGCVVVKAVDRLWVTVDKSVGMFCVKIKKNRFAGSFLMFMVSFTFRVFHRVVASRIPRIASYNSPSSFCSSTQYAKTFY